MNNIEKEFESMNAMIEYLTKNIDRLPITIQLQFMTEFVKFSNNIKPLYIAAIALRGDIKEDEKYD